MIVVPPPPPPDPPGQVLTVVKPGPPYASPVGVCLLNGIYLVPNGEFFIARLCPGDPSPAEQAAAEAQNSVLVRTEAYALTGTGAACPIPKARRGWDAWCEDTGDHRHGRVVWRRGSATAKAIIRYRAGETR